MKRKFFSLMVAACAAVASLTCFTGCSGGGGDGGNWFKTGKAVNFGTEYHVVFYPSGETYYEDTDGKTTWSTNCTLMLYGRQAMANVTAILTLPDGMKPDDPFAGKTVELSFLQVDEDDLGSIFEAFRQDGDGADGDDAEQGAQNAVPVNALTITMVFATETSGTFTANVVPVQGGGEGGGEGGGNEPVPVEGPFVITNGDGMW